MPEQLIEVEQFIAQCADGIVLDVRSPAEYAQGHIPGAVSWPLFSNEERAIVGTAYKQQSREAAIKIGLDFFGPKMRGMVEGVEKLIGDSCSLVAKNSNNKHIQKTNEQNVEVDSSQSELGAQDSFPQLGEGRDGGRWPSQHSAPSPLGEGRGEVLVYCWRGGMRSGAVAWLLGLYGFKVQRLQGGYKAFRAWALQQFDQTYQLKILGGYTGSGKTELLGALQQRGETVIDLEALARHKGSTFGNLMQEPQPTQEQFENDLAIALHNYQDKDIWLEDESRRIGYLMLANAFWQQMQAAPVYFLNLPFEERLQHILKGYGHYSTEQLTDGVKRIAKRLGPQHAKTATHALAAGDVEAGFRILLKYYDKLYDKGLQNRRQNKGEIRRIEGSTTGAANVVYLTATASYEKT